MNYVFGAKSVSKSNYRFILMSILLNIWCSLKMRTNVETVESGKYRKKQFWCWNECGSKNKGIPNACAIIILWKIKIIMAGMAVGVWNMK